MRPLSKEDILMVNSYIKRRSTSLIIREIKIETTMICQLMSLRMAFIRKQEIASVGQDVKKRKRLNTVGENVNRYSRHGKQYVGSTET